jgi:hypothetical protein
MMLIVVVVHCLVMVSALCFVLLCCGVRGFVAVIVRFELLSAVTVISRTRLSVTLYVYCFYF